MRNAIFATISAGVLSAEASKWVYPESFPEELVETIHGVEVGDPYRWLEDFNTEKAARWAQEQNALTDSFLSTVEGTEEISAHLTELWNYERYGLPYREGGRYFFSKNDGLQNQSVLYTCSDLKEEPRVLLDPNQLSEDGTVALSGYSVSPNGDYLAYAISKAGSDWKEWKVRQVSTGEDLEDHLEWSKFSGASWSKDSKGFYYGRFEQPEEGDEFTAKNTNKKIYYHRLGEKQESDQLVYERPDHPLWGLNVGVTDDGRFLIYSITQGTDTKNGLFYQDLTQEDSEVIELLADFDASYRYVTHDEKTLYIQTDWQAPKQQLIAVDLHEPERENWRTVIPEGEATLRAVNYVGGVLFAKYMKDAHSQVVRYGLDGKSLGEVALPGLGSVGGFGGEADSEETFYSYSSFTSPGTIYRYEIASGKSEVFRQAEVKFDPENYETKQVFFSSKDGTKVPLFIVHRKDVLLNGKNPTLLYGYGGFNISLTPGYSPVLMTWLDMGGVYVTANLRGGGEYGEDWHQAGMLDQKQNVFDDFIGAAEYLIAEKYTSSDKLAISGGSNGGLLVGACLVQRPDLFGACLPSVGVMDMLRFHKFTIGWAWQAEYGSPDKAEDFKVLRAYSPYHNLRKGESYPATMVMTSDHDDRVVPSHSYKFAAALQAANEGPNPMLIRIETKSGHGAGTPTSKRIEQATDKFAFLSKALDFPIKVKTAGRSNG
ncbi:prolyl oligopeptidase family serine peptidase [Roseibacillus ishigakijimensis]|uniref:prolyl oligopeptidase n=1 Tax=Roseibacillus ishigakijimensis TaxID=454146 RepID=A0A934RJ15_9BACT|nr:prolyl oligopeptidase family serine peptidase [Roseibacillus ishigakijimensis]MBK1832537.1 S9 family peptidase [Roseibacillus ishigakijimensis]